MAPQFPDFRRVRGRIRRTLGYGARQPHSINLPLSELVVDYFNKQSPFDYMRPETSASISGCGYADPCTLVVAMVYLDRLRVKNKKWFESSDPTDLYLPALVIASKFLHDADTCDRASNVDWAEAVNISSQHLSQLEWEFVQKMNWNVMVDQVEFDRWLAFFEFWVANDFVMKNGFCTYNEVVQLSTSFPIVPTIQCLAAFFGLMVMVSHEALLRLKSPNYNNPPRSEFLLYRARYALYLIPLFVLSGYVVFAYIKRQSAAEQMRAQAESMRPEIPKCEQIDPAKFSFLGPIKLQNKLHGKVEHQLKDESSHSLHELVYDENLNEVVDIGSNVEVVEGMSATTDSNISEDRWNHFVKTKAMRSGSRNSTRKLGVLKKVAKIKQTKRKRRKRVK